jgi:glycosyltransferase involved in cell wall biosynthesis
MRIAVVHPGSGWILSHIANRLAEAYPDIIESYTPTYLTEHILEDFSHIDAWVYCDIQNCYYAMLKEYYSKAIHVGLFTHLDKDSPESYRFHWGSLDGVVHMCERYYQMFLDNHFFHVDRMTIIRPGDVSSFPFRQVRFGICQRGEHIGKGAEFLPAVMDNLAADVADGIELVTLGKGWENKDFGVSHTCWLDESYDNYPAFYHHIDYLLIPSLWEGGPMALLEAMAAGIPIIAPDVGWVPEIMRELTTLLDMDGKDIDSNIEGVTYYRPSHFWLYKPGDIDGLSHIIDSIMSVRLAKRQVVASMSYEKYGRDLMNFINHLKGLRDGAFS